MTESVLNAPELVPSSGQQPQKSFQTVFRIASRKSPVRNPKVEDVLVSEIPTSTRRSHTKSRTGCLNCKKRRIKCDEKKPGCVKCTQYGVDCDYASSERSMPQSSRRNATVVVGTGGSNVLVVSTSTISNTIDPYRLRRNPMTLSPFTEALPYQITPYTQTLQHFQTFTCRTVSSPDGQLIFSSSILAIANECEYLMHAVLGTAAAHLACLTNEPDTQDSAARRKHQQAEAYHWQQALYGFRQALAAPYKMDRYEVDALLSTCMLLGIHLYTFGAAESPRSFIRQPLEAREQSLQWLKLQSGFRVVTGSVRESLNQSVWAPLFEQAGSPTSEVLLERAKLDDMFRDFADLCNVNNDPDEATNHYIIPLRNLCALHLTQEPSMNDFAQYVAFTGRFSGSFTGLLVQGDAAALLILAHWLALMSKLNLWWIKERAAQECQAIVEHLQCTSDSRVRRLLDFPARSLAMGP